ncbi:hypothetical protein [Thermomonospora cellulosilytica]|uniref:Uncharacterized protein n=1 Tax=Thermomonospora cellulosilytica TaxID=1411118 RepID=A0A7W3N211_9ACTN|nr:hypothetical protein [Thermomonospora cellulosilytica]MBA9006071.1 hypothetical protein [Thermomonospora cellulosilytica]
MSQHVRLRRTGRRIGRVATVMSAGTFAVAVGAAPALAAEPCPPGTDLESTLKNWECQWNNLWKPPVTASPSAPAPAKPAAPKPTTSTKPRQTGQKTTRPENRPAQRRTRPPGRVSAGGSAADVPTVNGDLRSYESQDVPEFPGTLPAPQVAPGGPAPSGRTLERTRIAPMAAAGPRQGDQMMWVAIASGAAGVVGALHLSVLSRSLRRRAAG